MVGLCTVALVAGLGGDWGGVVRGGGGQAQQAGGGVRRDVQWRRRPIWAQMGFGGPCLLLACLPCSVNGKLLLGSTRNTSTSGAPALGVAVVVGQLVVASHIQSQRQVGDDAAGENRAMTSVRAGDGGVFASLS